MQIAEDLKENGLIDDMEDLMKEIPSYTKVLEKCKYLGELTEDVIYQSYGDAIRHDNARPFDNFNQEHRDAYLRLKLRGIHSGP